MSVPDGKVCIALSHLIISLAINPSFQDLYLPLSIFAKENTPLFLQNANISKESKVDTGENSKHAETFFCYESDQELTRVA